jgi:gas vesicle protein
MGKKSSLSFGFGLIAGVISGVIAGVFYAPEPGEKSREKIKNTVTELAEKHSPEISEAKKQALESMDLVKYKIERQLRKLSHILKSKKLQIAKELEDTGYELN